MLLLVRMAPSLATYPQLRYVFHQSLIMQSTPAFTLPTSSMGKDPTRFAVTSIEDCLPVTKHSALFICRSYGSQPPPGDQSQPPNQKQSQPKQTLQISLPSKEQVEKVFFKVAVVVWDFSLIAINTSKDLFEKYVVQNPHVQTYWKIFHQKLDQARKKQD